jgi:hypothetical protein
VRLGWRRDRLTIQQTLLISHPHSCITSTSSSPPFSHHPADRGCLIGYIGTSGHMCIFGGFVDGVRRMVEIRKVLGELQTGKTVRLISKDSREEGWRMTHHFPRLSSRQGHSTPPAAYVISIARPLNTGVDNHSRMRSRIVSWSR